MDALRAQLAAVKAGTNNKELITKIRDAINAIRDPEEPKEPDTDTDDFKAFKAMLTTPATFDENEATRLMTSLQGLDLPEDGALPADLDLKKIRATIKSFAESAAPEITDNFKARCYLIIETVFDVWLDTRPVEAVFASALATLNGAEASEEDLDAAIAKITSNAKRIRRAS